MPDQQNCLYIQIILPLALPTEYTYIVPVELCDHIKIGIRVEVSLKKKLYSGLVHKTYHSEYLEGHKLIISIIDEEAIVNQEQIQMWEWMAQYYCCTLGEIMIAALPSALKLSSETKISLNRGIGEDLIFENDKMHIIREALLHQEDMTIADLQSMLDQKTVYPLIKRMIEENAIVLREDFGERGYKPKFATFLSLHDDFVGQREEGFADVLRLLKRSEQQSNAFLTFAELTEDTPVVAKASVMQESGVSSQVIHQLIKKGILETQQLEISRLKPRSSYKNHTSSLSVKQEAVKSEIQTYFKHGNVMLLHGVTGSGKTKIYIELIREVLENQGQALFLLPEIGLTAQMVERIEYEFGEKVWFYHSRMNMNEKVELWQKIKTDSAVILGARSSIFLPFFKLDLIIVDEEHDSSYKQQDPNPRYNARDVAIYMSSIFRSKILLGSATPSLESLHNAQSQKYGYTTLEERFGESKLPEISIVDLKIESKENRIKHHFSETLLQSIGDKLAKKEQVLIFQNRRGYAPTMKCYQCGWHAECPNCDISLTVHQFIEELRCHYCSHRSHLPKSCVVCGNRNLVLMGFGTEKIEEKLKELIPHARIARMDYDTVKSKAKYHQILTDVKNQNVDILVGTQMITKGLDFENITLVGVLNADLLLNFPDFRASERAFQLLTQVSGRAGRKDKLGEVMIQLYQTSHPVIEEVLNDDFKTFSERELSERSKFVYPPYCRLIALTIKHKNNMVVERASIHLANVLKGRLGSRIYGPTVPGVARLRNYYLRSILIKIEKSRKVIHQVKTILTESIIDIKSIEGFKSIRVIIDVDPY